MPSSDALQAREYDEARRAEHERKLRAERDVGEQEHDRERKEREELRKAEVRPDCVVLLCRRAYVPDALQEARRAERTQEQEQERKKQRDERNVRPDCVLCFARRD